MRRLTRLSSAWALAAALWAVGGCDLYEHSFPMRSGDHVRLAAVSAGAAPSDRPDTRQWLVQANRQLAHLLPPSDKAPLLSDDLTDAAGRPIDVMRHFGLDFGRQESIWFNYAGLRHTAQVVGRDDREPVLAPWPGFEDVWIPVHDPAAEPSGNGEPLKLGGRLGLARGPDGRIADADCIIVLSGLRGHLDIHRTRNLCDAFVANGLHALALELRGHGRTDDRCPQALYTWGVLETDDLLAVADWLQRRPHVRRTGLIGFSWGSNHGLLVAWREAAGRQGATPDAVPRAAIRPNLTPYLRPLPPGRHFQAGVIAFSPVLRFEDLMDRLETERSIWFHPVLHALQRTVRLRMIQENWPGPDGNLRRLTRRSPINYPGAPEDALAFLRLMPYKGLSGGDKLAAVRVPLLIVYAANDPMESAQNVADLMATVRNPAVAAIVLGGGGHDGFVAFSRAWYYSLIVNFFDPQAGASGKT